VDDEVQLEDIWKHLRLNTVAIDYFLNNFVFPKHAKQFDMKLQASGWDIPLFLPTSGNRLSELGLLHEISKMGCQVLIDSGSQILEMDNLTLARAWLDFYPDAPGAVYFGQDNRPWVIYRKCTLPQYLFLAR
jgi:hypothetical protein